MAGKDPVIALVEGEVAKIAQLGWDSPGDAVAADDEALQAMELAQLRGECAADGVAGEVERDQALQGANRGREGAHQIVVRQPELRDAANAAIGTFDVQIARHEARGSVVMAVEMTRVARRCMRLPATVIIPVAAVKAFVELLEHHEIIQLDEKGRRERDAVAISDRVRVVGSERRSWRWRGRWWGGWWRRRWRRWGR